jgi:hypothetical protein
MHRATSQSTRWTFAAGVVGLWWLGACVPEGPPTPTRAASKPPAGPLSALPGPARSAAPVSVISAAYEDRFERKELGPDWLALSPAWRIEDGELCAKGARNRGAWLKPGLPERARIEFDARSDSQEGDIKAELWGDGKTGATGSSYSNATSYLAILGGWQNTKHVLARLDEHGKDRLELEVDPEAPEPRALPVEPGQTYRFRVERSDESKVSWWVDDHLVFELTDPEPLRGEGHDHVGFNEWAARVCFDNLKITPL